MTNTPDTTPQPNYPDQIISNKPQPGAEHAVNAAPISADLRRISGTHPAAVAQQDPLLLAMHLRQRAKLVTAGSVDALSENAANVLAAQQERIEELERYQAAFNEWHDKTEWVQKTVKPKELGKHRADVLRERIEALTAQPARECLQQSAAAAHNGRVAAAKAVLRELGRAHGVYLTVPSALRIVDAVLQAAPPLNPVEPGALHASIRELDAWESRADGNELTPSESESVVLVLHELKRLQAAPPAPAGVAVPLQQFESPRAQILLRAFQEGWGACRDAEYVGEEAENDAFNRSATLGHCIAEDQLHRPAAPAQEHATQLAGQGVEGETVAYLDLGAGGYLDIGTDLSDEQLSKLPKGRHMLVISGTHGVDGYAAVPAQVQDVPTPWLPYLSDRADGVRGHYAIARHNPAGYREVWNLRSHRWASASDEVLTHDEALAILRKLEMPTAATAPAQAQEDAHTETAGAPSREEIASLRASYGITSSGRGIKEFEQVASFAQAVLARWSAAPIQAQEDARDAQIAKLTTAYTELSNMFHDQIVAQQAAWIEWQHGQGAEAAMGWIENGLCGPGHIPDEDAPYGKEAQAWYDANNSDPFPACQCGRPSNIMWMGMGFCCKAHHDAARAAQGGAA